MSMFRASLYVLGSVIAMSGCGGSSSLSTASRQPTTIAKASQSPVPKAAPTSDSDHPKALDRATRLTRAERMEAARKLLDQGDAREAERAFAAIFAEFKGPGDELVEAGRAATKAHDAVLAESDFEKGAASLEAWTSSKRAAAYPHPLSDTKAQAVSFQQHEPLQWIRGTHEIAVLDDRGASLVDVARGMRETRRAPSKLKEHKVRVDPLGRFVAESSVAIGSHGFINLLSFEDGDTMETIQNGDDSITSFAFQPSGKDLVWGTVDGKIRIFDVETRALIASPTSIDNHTIEGIAMTDAGTIVVRSYDSAAVISPSGEILAKRQGAFTDGVFSDDGKLAVLTGSAVEVIDATSGKSLASLRDGKIGWESAAISRDGEVIATGSDQATIQLWIKQKGTYQKARNIIVEGPAVALAFHPDGRSLAAMVHPVRSVDFQAMHLEVFDVASLAPIAETPSLPLSIRATAASGNGSIATALADQSVRIWDPATGNELARIDAPSAIAAIAFLPSDTSIALACADGHARIYGLADQKLTLDIATGAAPLASIAVSPKGDLLATGGQDRTLRVFDLAKGSPRGKHEGYGAWTHVLFDREGTELIGINDKQTMSFSTASSKSTALGRYVPPTSGGPYLIAMVNDGVDSLGLPNALIDNGIGGNAEPAASTPDRSLIANRNRLDYLDWGIAVWATSDRKQTWAPRMHAGIARPVESVVLAAYGKLVVVTSDDGATRVFDVATGMMVYTRIVEQGSTGAAIIVPDGRYELADGATSSSLSCAIGAYRLPIEACGPRLATHELVAKLRAKN